MQTSQSSIAASRLLQRNIAVQRRRRRITRRAVSRFADSCSQLNSCSQLIRTVLLGDFMVAKITQQPCLSRPAFGGHECRRLDRTRACDRVRRESTICRSGRFLHRSEAGAASPTAALRRNAGVAEPKTPRPARGSRLSRPQGPLSCVPATSLLALSAGDDLRSWSRSEDVADTDADRDG